MNKWILAFLIFPLISGCCSTPQPTESFPSVALSAPWLDLKIPVKDGVVVYSDSGLVKVVYRDVKEDNEHTVNIIAALVKEGWQAGNISTGVGSNFWEFERNEKKLEMWQMEGAGVVIIAVQCNDCAPIELTPPWTELAIPTDKGTLLESSADWLMIGFDSEDQETCIALFEEFLLKAGWKKISQNKEMGIQISFEQEKQCLDMSLSEEGKVLVELKRYDCK